MAPDKTAVVIDEGHLCKNHATLRGRVPQACLSSHRHADGHPLQNSMDGFFCLLNLLQPGIVGPGLARSGNTCRIRSRPAWQRVETDSFKLGVRGASKTSAGCDDHPHSAYSTSNCPLRQGTARLLPPAASRDSGNFLRPRPAWTADCALKRLIWSSH